MAIQVTLSANQFNYSGTYNGRDYTSLQVNRTSKGRIYFSIVRDGIRWCEMAKQVKYDDGKAFVSFGKNDKLVIGTYTDDIVQEDKVTADTPEEVWEALKEGKKVLMNKNDLKSFDKYAESFDTPDRNLNFNVKVSILKETTTDDKTCVLFVNGYKELIEIYKNDRARMDRIKKEIEEQPATEQQTVNSTNIQSLFTNVTPNKYTPNVIDYITHGNYAFQLSEGKDNHSINPNSKLYSVICINMLTGEIDNTKCTCYDEGICQVIYLSKEAALKDINSYSVNESIEPKQSTINPTKQPAPVNNKPDPLTESFPQLNMIADYANIQYTGNKALITFTNPNESNTVTFKYRKSWSARKYIDTAFNKTGIKPSWKFKYGWEYIP